MIFYSFFYLNHKPEDFNKYARVKSSDIGFPGRNKITAEIPFSNNKYDFSSIYGGQTYSERELEYVIHVFNPDDLTDQQMHQIKTKLANWLESGKGKQPLVDEKLPGWHFMAEPETALSLEDNYQSGELTVKFIAYPFMIRDSAEGDDVWDTFNFEYDVAQITSFKVDGSKTVLLINSGITTSYPEIIADADMTITIGNSEYSIKAGTSTGIELPIGEINVLVKGTGDVSLVWHKEVI